DYYCYSTDTSGNGSF
nr:immunoglobulin light chain junction region [Macaca mulatta]